MLREPLATLDIFLSATMDELIEEQELEYARHKFEFSKTSETAYIKATSPGTMLETKNSLPATRGDAPCALFSLCMNFMD